MKIGDKVVCINVNWSVDPQNFPDVTFPELYQELTIRDIYYYPLDGGLIDLVFEEIRNPLKGYPIVTQLFGRDIEHDFDSKRFAKLEDRKIEEKKTNALTKKLALKALEEYPEYNPEELIKEVLI